MHQMETHPQPRIVISLSAGSNNGKAIQVHEVVLYRSWSSQAVMRLTNKLLRVPATHNQELLQPSTNTRRKEQATD